MAQVLGSAETMRAKQIKLSVPDGRSVAMLVNSTQIRSADGETASVVVTMQDLAPLQELDRMPAEFLGTSRRSSEFERQVTADDSRGRMGAAVQ